MKKKIITATLITALGMTAFLLGKTQAKPIPENCLNTESKEFYDNYIDMRTVTDFDATETSLVLYTDDGSGYYWER